MFSFFDDWLILMTDWFFFWYVADEIIRNQQIWKDIAAWWIMCQTHLSFFSVNYCMLCIILFYSTYTFFCVNYSELNACEYIPRICKFICSIFSFLKSSDAREWIQRNVSSSAASTSVFSLIRWNIDTKSSESTL